MKGILCSTTARTNDEYRKVVKNRIRKMIGLIVIGLVTLGLSAYADLYIKSANVEHMVSMYSGLGVGLIFVGIIFLIKNRNLLRDEQKLKESRLSNSDERIEEISTKALRTATYMMLIVLYATALVAGIFIPEITIILMLIACIFVISYFAAFKYYNGRM